MLKVVINLDKHDTAYWSRCKELVYITKYVIRSFTGRLKKKKYSLPKLKIKLIIPINVCIH